MGSMESLIDIILLAALRPWGNLASPEMSTRNISWG